MGQRQQLGAALLIDAHQLGGCRSIQPACGCRTVIAPGQGIGERHGPARCRVLDEQVDDTRPATRCGRRPDCGGEHTGRHGAVVGQSLRLDRMHDVVVTLGGQVEQRSEVARGRAERSQFGAEPGGVVEQREANRHVADEVAVDLPRREQVGTSVGGGDRLVGVAGGPSGIDEFVRVGRAEPDHRPVLVALGVDRGQRAGDRDRTVDDDHRPTVCRGAR